MDYSIGSVADIISGSVTPNKQKVVKKQIKSARKSLNKSQQEENMQEQSMQLIKNERKSLNKSKHEENVETPNIQIKNERKSLNKSQQGKNGTPNKQQTKNERKSLNKSKQGEHMETKQSPIARNLKNETPNKQLTKKERISLNKSKQEENIQTKLSPNVKKLQNKTPNKQSASQKLKNKNKAKKQKQSLSPKQAEIHDSENEEQSDDNSNTKDLLSDEEQSDDDSDTKDLSNEEQSDDDFKSNDLLSNSEEDDDINSNSSDSDDDDDNALDNEFGDHLDKIGDIFKNNEDDDDSDNSDEMEVEEPVNKKKLKRKASNSVGEDELPKTKKSKKQMKKAEKSKESNENEENDSSDNENKVQSPEGEAISPNPNHVTVFIGNLPITMTQKKLKKLFAKFGNVVNARIRSIPVANPKIPKKVAAIKKEFHPDRNSVHGYVTFSERESAEKALSYNGHVYKDHHLRVNISDETQNLDKNKAIFLGNVKFDAEEEELWQLFKSCGDIESVRLVRDKITNVGKGFGYVNFKSSDSVELALQMGEVKLRDRVLRISLYNSKAPKKENTIQKPRNTNVQRKKFLISKDGEENEKGQFQGKVATTEKKKKFNKGNRQRMELAKKIAPKSMSS